MRAAVLKGPLEFKVEDVPRPSADPGEVVIKVKYCGICGSELHYYEAGEPVNAVLGHEYVGTVHQVGEDVEGFSRGQRVTSIPMDPPCGKCFWCHRGEIHLCPALLEGSVGTKPGAFAEYVKRDVRTIVPLPDCLPDKAASLIEPLGVCLHALNLSEMKLGERVAVLGCGPIGLLMTKLVSLAGAARVYATDKVPKRLELARQMGALETFLPDHKDLMGTILKGTEGVGVDVVFDCVGIPETIQSAQILARKGGRVILVGIHLGEASISPLMFVVRELALKGSIGYYHEFFQAMELLERERMPFEDLITDTIPLEKLNQACSRLLKPTEDVKILVNPERKED